MQVRSVEGLLRPRASNAHLPLPWDRTLPAAVPLVLRLAIGTHCSPTPLLRATGQPGWHVLSVIQHLDAKYS